MSILNLISNIFGNRPKAHEVAISVECCKSPELEELEDFGHACSFDFMHTTCKSCGAHWLNVFCVANGATGYERLSDGDAQTLLNAAPGPERKTLLKEWADEKL